MNDNGSTGARHTATVPHLGTVTFDVVLANPEALQALGYVHEVLTEFAEDFEWRPEAKNALESLEYAMDYLEPRCIGIDEEPGT